jgi:hypothetical protein
VGRERERGKLQERNRVNKVVIKKKKRKREKKGG